MANRYWVGGTNTWDGTAGTKWASTSGGIGGQSVPTSSDDVFFDANSGSVTVYVTTSDVAYCNNLTMSGFTGTVALSSGKEIYVYGSFVGSSGGAFTRGNDASVLKMQNTSTASITTNGMIMPSIYFIGTGVFTFQDNFSQLTLTRFFIYNGTVNTNGKTLIIGSTVTQSGTSTFNISNSNITISRNNVATMLDFTLGTVTFTATGSTVTVSAGNIKGNGKTFNDFVINANSTISGSNTFNDLKVNAGKTATFTAGATQTVSSFSSGGTSGNLASIRSSSAGSAFTLSDSSGTNTVSYMSIKDCTATGGASWAAVNSIDVSGNSGWVFSVESKGNFLPFL